MYTDLKTSLLVEGQVPEFVRDEHPLFVSFLEAYYEFLEQEQGSQNNDLTTKSKLLRNLSDVDVSIDEFEESFINNFASLIPQDAISDKSLLIKNVLPLYLARGNEKSFQFLFRLLYGEDVKVILPRNNVLRASAGDWTLENVLRVDDNIYSFYTGNGTTTTFLLVQQVDNTGITVYVDGVETSSGFYVRKESKKLIFETAPANGADIKVYYDNFDETLLNNRRVVGSSSGASAIIEKSIPRLIGTQTSTELYINTNTLFGTFLNAEVITTDILADDGVTLIQIGSETVSPLNRITVVDGGSGYNVGDVVIITGGAPTTEAEAVVGSIFAGAVDAASVGLGGAGFQLGGLISTSNVSGTITLAVTAVDDSGANSANSFTIFTDVIDTYANVSISASDYGFPANVIPTGENVATRLIDAFSKGTVTGIGPMTDIVILFSDVGPEGAIFDADGAKIETLANTFIDIKTFGALGRIQINDGGDGYEIGDEIVFGANPPSVFGVGAAAAVTNVSSAGAITKVEFQPSRITGTANTESGNVTIVGNGTSFDTELEVGSQIMINSEARYVNTITSATSLNVNVAFDRTSTERAIGKFDTYLIGGQGYVQNNFPTITVSSANTSAANANVEIIALMGDGETIGATVSTTAGQIREITITNPGKGYEILPVIDLTQSGDGNATATAEIERSYVSLTGRWLSSEGILSAFERKVQGLDYYIDFTYVTEVAVEFAKYKEILKGLLHPAGFKNYAEYPIVKTIDTTFTTSSIKGLSVSGTVEISNGSNTVTGTDTQFVTANSLGIITIGTQIVVNNEIRTIDNVISATSLTVSNAFTTNATSQTVILLA